MTHRAWIALAVLVLSGASRLDAQELPGATPAVQAALQRGEWPAYAGSNGSLRWSPLDVIDKTNASKLQVLWRWRSPDHDLRAAGVKAAPSFSNESTPVMVGGTLYTSTSLSQIAAIDAATGQTKWVHDPKAYRNTRQPANLGWANMGVAYWKSGDDERVIIVTGDAFLVAVDARTGKPVEAFGENGRVDLATGLRREISRDDYTSQAPPLVVGDVVVVGSSVFDFWMKRLPPPGDVRGFDVRTGKRLWTFHTVPQAGEPGVETWEGEFLARNRQRQCLGADERRRSAGLRLSAGEHTVQRLLWWPSVGRRPLWRQSGLSRRQDRPQGLALPDGAARPVGL